MDKTAVYEIMILPETITWGKIISPFLIIAFLPSCLLSSIYY